MAVVALMVGLEAQESGSRFDGCGGALALPVKGTKVVGPLQRRALSQVKTGRGGEGLNDATSKLKVSIGKLASGVVPCREGIGDIAGERHTPDNGPWLCIWTPSWAGLSAQWLQTYNGSGGWEDDATGPLAGCIVCTMNGGHQRHKFLDANGSVINSPMQVPKVIQDIVNVFSEA